MAGRTKIGPREMHYARLGDPRAILPFWVKPRFLSYRAGDLIASLCLLELDQRQVVPCCRSRLRKP